MKKEYTIELKEAASDIHKEDKLVILPYEQMDVGGHDHAFFELVYITGGTTIHILNDEETNLTAGDYFIVDYGSVHRYTDSKNLTLINCLFLPEIISEELKGCDSFEELLHSCLIRYYKLTLSKKSANRVFQDREERVLLLLKGILREYEKKEMGYQEIFRCKLLEILLLTLRGMTDTAKTYQNKTVLDLIAYIDSSYETSCILSGFCKTHHYTKQYISRKFKQETGYTVMEYLHKVRMEKSCELLAGTNLLVSEIAQKVGYADVKFFQTIFTRMIKMTPREYRKIVMQA